MRNVFFSIAYSFLTTIGLFSNLTFAANVTTGEATNVTSNSATLNGIVSNSRSPSEWFEYGTVSAAYTDVTSKQTICGSSNISVSIRTGKLPNTFFYRIVAQNSAGTTYGSEKYFTSLATPILTITPTPSATPTATATPSPTSTPCVNMETGDATDITSNSATLNAIVCFGTTANYMYFEYGAISGSYTSSVDAETIDMSDQVSAKISELSPKTTYYYRIAIQQKPVPPSSGYVYGEEKSFTTLPACEAKEITTSSGKLRLKIGKSSEVIVALKGDDCVPAGNTVTATIGKIGSKRIWVTPTSQATDENGQAKFTITARNKAGNAKVTFMIENFPNINKTMLVKVR